jgi:ribosome biogenesis GTPase
MQLSELLLKVLAASIYVEAADSVYESKARGIFRKEKITPLVGDYVK